MTVSLIDPGHEVNLTAPTTDRFSTRWRFVGAGLSNVWRYADLELPAISGRLLLRGLNGTGKTTALEVLWPYLLDLNARQLSAGKARTTNLTALMAEDSGGKRRTGYVWVTFASAGATEIVTYGVRLNYSPGATPPVGVVPFMIHGRPLHELALWKSGRESLNSDELAAAVGAAGGVVFGDESDYRHDLATRLFGVEPEELRALTRQIHFVRNPTRLAETSADAASEQLCESLPTVEENRIEATADALAESETTRLAFERDRQAAASLAHFATSWVGHVREAATEVTTRAADALKNIDARTRELRRHRRDLDAALERESKATAESARLGAESTEAAGQRRAIEQSDLYKSAERLGDLQQTMEAKESTAATALGSLERAVDHGTATRTQLEARAIDIEEDFERQSDAVKTVAPDLVAPLPLAVSYRPRAVVAIGNTEIVPGPELVLDADTEALARIAASWSERAQELTSKGARAKVLEKAHRRVADLEQRGQLARAEATRTSTTASERAAEARTASADSRALASDLEATIGAWRAALHDDPGFSLDDVVPGSWATLETSEALTMSDELATVVNEWAHGRAATQRARGQALLARAGELRDEADAARREAEALRSGEVLLPLPRPGWVSDGDDEHAFAAALAWNPDVPDAVQDAIEDALANSGVLGAALEPGGVQSASWAVRVRGAVQEVRLADVLVVEDSHPLAEVAAAVLSRIELVPDASALGAARGELVIGRDGAFRAGPLEANPDGRTIGRATHIGAARRRAAALERALELDQFAAGLETEATNHEDEATTAELLAVAVLETAAAFPDRAALRDAESARVSAARAEQAASAKAAQAELAAQGAESEARRALETWCEDVRAAGLPTAIDDLRQFIAGAEADASVLRAAGAEVGGRQLTRLGNLVRDARAAAEGSALTTLVAQATSQHTSAAEARAAYEALLSQHGAAAAELMHSYEDVQQRIELLDAAVIEAGRELSEASNERVRLETRTQTSEEELEEARPAATRAVGEVRTFLAVEGVRAALLGEVVEAEADHELIDQVRNASSGKKTAMRTLLEERDGIGAELVETWKIHHRDDAASGLMAFELTNENQSYSPISAAAHAQRQADRAQEALSLAQEDALTRFVVGSLPGAIATAWTRLQDWKRDVNTKMREASASSGVGVSVRVNVREDLAPTERMLYELTCKGALTSETKRAAGECIKKLIDESNAEDMKDRVRDAVDIRRWVYIEYLITRPDQESKKWGKRTSLSGGERRLVVLSPMLAAIAAAYDKLGPSAPRLAALDEVPAEVDLAGREGLARYLAALDLDLIATSHEWDGAPGAWDGIDAQDFERGSDGTVVAFHMPVRSVGPLPGEELADYPGPLVTSDGA